MKIYIIKFALLFSLAFIFSCQPIYTYRMPDFQIRSVSLVNNELIAQIQNNGLKSYTGDLQLRVFIIASLSEGHAVDKIFTVNNSWGPGEVKPIVLISNLIPENWPDAIDYPQKTVAIKVDFGNHIIELDESNNLFEATFNVPCNTHITQIIPSTINIDSFDQAYSLNLRGEFGSIQGSKKIVMQTLNGNSGVTFQNIQWHPSNITVNSTNSFLFLLLPGACYDVLVECAPEDTYTKAYTSNTKRVCVEGNLIPDSGTNPAQCPTPIQMQGWRYAGPPADCWSNDLIRSAGSVCDENGWYCCMLNSDAQGSERCNTGYQEMIPPCCRSSVMTCNPVLRQPYGCYERDD